MKQKLQQAAELALMEKWKDAHEIAQIYNDPIACWIHAVLHKIEQDESNSRYWYARANRRYEDFSDSNDELKEIIQALILRGT
ncbi:MAG: hypothetical protein ACAH12_10715 [Methylophilaceae bacterium]